MRRLVGEGKGRWGRWPVTMWLKSGGREKDGRCCGRRRTIRNASCNTRRTHQAPETLSSSGPQISRTLPSLGSRHFLTWQLRAHQALPRRRGVSASQPRIACPPTSTTYPSPYDTKKILYHISRILWIASVCSNFSSAATFPSWRVRVGTPHLGWDLRRLRLLSRPTVWLESL